MSEKRPRRLRIALQIERFTPGRGGAEGYARSLARGLAALGEDVTVLSAEGSDPPAGVNLRLLGGLRHPKSLGVISFARRSARAASQGGFDIVHGMGKSLGMNLLNPHGGVQKVWLERQRDSYSGALERALWTSARYLSPRHHIIRWVLRQQYLDRGVSRYVALSRSIRDAMVRVHGVDPRKIVILPNRVDTARFQPASSQEERDRLRRELGFSTEELLFLFVGHNFRLKGLEPLVLALERVKRRGPPLRIAVIGRGNVPRYRRLAARHGVEGLFRFCGTVSGMEKWYQAADGFLHPTFFDACSLALPEAMSSGLPVLASRHDGSAEPITEGLEGVLVEDPRDLAALAAGLEKMLDMDFRQSAGKAARALMLKTPFRDPAVEMLEIYREALMSSPSTVN